MSDYHDAKAAGPVPLNVAFDETKPTASSPSLRGMPTFAASTGARYRPIPCAPYSELLNRWRSGLSTSPWPMSSHNGKMMAA